MCHSSSRLPANGCDNHQPPLGRASSFCFIASAGNPTCLKITLEWCKPLKRPRTSDISGVWRRIKRRVCVWRRRERCDPCKHGDAARQRHSRYALIRQWLHSMFSSAKSQTTCLYNHRQHKVCCSFTIYLNSPGFQRPDSKHIRIFRKGHGV